MQSPTEQITKPRILTVDALRGFALFGIFFAHMIFWYAGGPLPQDYYQMYHDIGSGIAIGVYMLFFSAKFFSIFSFLFGLSFYIQMESLAKTYQHVAVRFAWRLTILGVIGILHHCFWRADILSIYVPLGFILLFCRHLSDKALLILGLACVFNLPTKIEELVSILGFNHYPLLDSEYAQDSTAMLFAFTQANFVEMIQHNINATDSKIIYQVNSGRIWITFGFFLLGMLVGRWRWFEQIETHKGTFIKICKKSAWWLVGVLGLFIVIAAGVFITKIDTEKNFMLQVLGGFLFDVSSALITAIYITGFTLFMLKPKWLTRLSVLAPIGKMALTTYLTQSIIGVFLFFNIGFGLFGLTSPAQNTLVAVAIFGLQIIFCRWWLTHFQYGPIEWFWRSATDLKWRPIKK